MKTKLHDLMDVGQSVWLDYLHRRMTRSGELQALIDKGLRGMTSNPTIFEHAIGGGADYDRQLSELMSSARTDREIFEALAIEDVREAADAFRHVYDSTGGRDGFVSLDGARSGSRHRRVGNGGSPALAGSEPAERDDQDSGHSRGLARHRTLPQRRNQYQHHTPVLG
jgi:hypothetical protein